MHESTLTALLESNRSVDRSIVYLEGERESRTVSFGALHERALGILYFLQELGARPGDRLILLLSGNEPFIDAFWAAVMGGIIPVPVGPGISDEHRHKLLRIASKLGTPYLYTEQRLLDRVGEFARQQGQAQLFESLRARSFLVDALESIGRPGRVHRSRPEDVAFIQFSSGSTSQPKGVVLTHANLIANIRAVSEAAALSEHDVGLSWMPLTHDMGLIGFHLMMFANRMRAHLMPTELFVRRPLLWLQRASELHASILCSPNFGYRHYLNVLGQRPVDGIDLSAVRLLFNGAEPISVELCEEFLTRLAPTGLQRRSLFPVYGLAEATLAVSFPEPGTPPRVLALDRHRLRMGTRVHELQSGHPDALQLMSVGRPVPLCELRITDEQDRPLPELSVGQIQIRGQNVTSGYLEDPEANESAFTADGWLRTGDLGVLCDGELFVTGRTKEILFVNGQNYYPQDLEQIAGRLPGLETGRLVIASARPPGGDRERIVAFVLHRGELAEFVPLARTLVLTLAERAGIELDAVVPVRRIPKTTSGKVQRHLLEADYLAGAFDEALHALERMSRAAPEQPPGRGVEHELLSMCEAELEGRHLDPEESLFELGASSLKLISIHERIDRRWPGVVEITDIFEHPSVRALGSFIESRVGRGPELG